MQTYGGPQVKPFSPRQNHFRHGKTIFATAKTISSWQNHFRHGKTIFVTAKTISPRQNHFRHGRIICTHVTLIDKVLWNQYNMADVQLVVLSSVTSHNSRSQLRSITHAPLSLLLLKGRGVKKGDCFNICD